MPPREHVEVSRFEPRAHNVPDPRPLVEGDNLHEKIQKFGLAESFATGRHGGQRFYESIESGIVVDGDGFDYWIVLAPRIPSRRWAVRGSPILFCSDGQ
jgi:hypothetical protein